MIPTISIEKTAPHSKGTKKRGEEKGHAALFTRKIVAAIDQASGDKSKWPFHDMTHCQCASFRCPHLNILVLEIGMETSIPIQLMIHA